MYVTRFGQDSDPDLSIFIWLADVVRLKENALPCREIKPSEME